MHRLYNLKDTLVNELEQIGAKDHIDREDLELVDTLAHATKNLCKVIESCEEEEYGDKMDGSFASMPRFRMSSYARGRRGNVKRDSMGRYSSTGDLKMELEDMMQNAPNEAIRQKLMETINMM